MKVLMLAAGLVMAVVAFVGGAVNLSSLLWLHSTDNSYVVGAADTLLVRNECGNVTVREDPSATRVTATGQSWSTFRTPAVDVGLENGQAVVRGRCNGSWWGVGHGLKLVVTVPTGTNVDAASDSGSLSLVALSGTVVAESSAGSIRGTALTSASLTAESSAGSVHLTFVGAPSQVDAESSAGSVTVEVPRDGTTYVVSADSSAGSTKVTVATDPEAQRTIAAHSSAGSVAVRYIGD
jgi:hypothetical protein